MNSFGLAMGSGSSIVLHDRLRTSFDDIRGDRVASHFVLCDPQQATCFFVEGLCYTRRRLLLALWEASAAVGKSFCAQGVLGNGPRVTGS